MNMASRKPILDFSVSSLLEKQSPEIKIASEFLTHPNDQFPNSQGETVLSQCWTGSSNPKQLQRADCTVNYFQTTPDFCSSGCTFTETIHHGTREPIVAHTIGTRMTVPSIRTSELSISAENAPYTTESLSSTPDTLEKIKMDEWRNVTESWYRQLMRMPQLIWPNHLRALYLQTCKTLGIGFNSLLPYPSSSATLNPTTCELPSELFRKQGSTKHRRSFGVTLQHAQRRYSTIQRGTHGRGMLRRAVFSDHQRQGLELAFSQHAYIAKPDRKTLADQLGLKDAQVKIWFQNRRMKWRSSRQRTYPSDVAQNSSTTNQVESSSTSQVHFDHNPLPSNYIEQIDGVKTVPEEPQAPRLFISAPDLKLFSSTTASVTRQEFKPSCSLKSEDSGENGIGLEQSECMHTPQAGDNLPPTTLLNLQSELNLSAETRRLEAVQHEQELWPHWLHNNKLIRHVS